MKPARNAMDENRLEQLRTLDWEAITTKVLKSALFRSLLYGWDADSSLPNGKSVEDVVVEAICELWSDPSRICEDVAIEKQLDGMVRSKLWNLSQSADEDVVRTDAMEEVAVDHRKNATDEIDAKDEFDRAIELLSMHPKVTGKPEHELVLTAISCGAEDVDQIVTETEIPRERVYQIRRELRALYPVIAKQLRNA
jgi:hypothetical protein